MASNLVETQIQFSSLYDQHVRGVYNFIYYRAGHKQTAEDLTAQVFLKALENWPKFDAEKGSFKTWIYRIARNTLIDHWRTSKTSSPLDEAAPLPGSGGPEEEVDRGFAAAEAANLLSRLTPEERELVIMRVWDELSYKEIAIILGKSEAAAKMGFARTIGKLREHSVSAIAFLVLIGERINL